MTLMQPPSNSRRLLARQPPKILDRSLDKAIVMRAGTHTHPRIVA